MVVSAMPELKPMRERVKSVPDIFGHVAPFKPPIFESPHKLMKKFGESVLKAGTIAVGVQRFVKRAYGTDVPLASVEPAGAEVATMEYPRAVELLNNRYAQFLSDINAMFDCKWIGQFEYMPEGVARFSYFLPRREWNLTTVKTHRTRHVHDIVRAEAHELPARDVPRPARVDELIRILRDTLPELYPYGRIITGLEIVKGEHYEDSDSERTWLGRVIDGGKAAASMTADATAAAAKATGRALTSKAAAVAAGTAVAATATGAAVWGLVSLLGSAVAVIAADPALCVGERVLYGWD